MSDETFELRLAREEGFRFTVDFGQEGVPDLVVDEPPPLGDGSGPNPTRLLAAAVGDCLSASLLFCLQKRRVPVEAMQTWVEGTVVRNERGRLRVGGLRVRLEPTISAEHRDRVERCLDVFEDFCIVTQSVRRGIDVEVTVEPRTGGEGGESADEVEPVPAAAGAG